MVQILPEVPSFGAQFARNLGSGIGQGVSKAADFASQMAQEKYKINLRKKLIGDIEGESSAAQSNSNRLTPQDLEQKFIQALPEIKKHLGRELTPKDLDELWSKTQQLHGNEQSRGKSQEDLFDKAKKYAVAGEDKLADIAKEEGKQTRKERFQREKEGEPKVQALQDRQNSLESEAMDFARLGELFRPELDKKFPSSTLVGFLTKDGELNPNVIANLSEEAQEAIKLIANRVTGLKDTFGSQITGFEVRKFMERLPGLLNSPEGRRRVLRDLNIANELNQLHATGVLDIIDRYGGPGEISFSKAERIFKKEYASQIKELRDEYVNPHKNSFSELTPSSASRYPNEYAIDEETGQKFRSDGKEWIPVED